MERLKNPLRNPLLPFSSNQNLYAVPRLTLQNRDDLEIDKPTPIQSGEQIIHKFNGKPQAAVAVPPNESSIIDVPVYIVTTQQLGSLITSHVARDIIVSLNQSKAYTPQQPLHDVNFTSGKKLATVSNTARKLPVNILVINGIKIVATPSANLPSKMREELLLVGDKNMHYLGSGRWRWMASDGGGIVESQGPLSLDDQTRIVK